MNNREEYQVGVEYDGSRLDRYIRSVLPGVAQSLIQKLLRKGDIRLNNKKAGSAARIVNGDIVSIWNAASITARAEAVQVVRCDELLQLISDSIIYKDENIIAINKPTGLSVQGGSKVRVSICDLLDKIIPCENLHIVHRLDKDTSGVLMLARNRAVARLIAEQLRCRKIHKEYLAVTRGVPTPRSGEIIIPVFYKNGQTGRVTEKDARTIFSVIKEHNGNAVMLLSPVTGRKHQLRIHMAKRDCPIIGDAKYCNSAGVEEKTELHLHALRITFDLFDRKIAIVAPLPKHMLETMNVLFGEIPDELSVLL